MSTMAGAQALADLTGEVTELLLAIGYALRQCLDAEVGRPGRRMQARMCRLLAECSAAFDDLDEAELRALRDGLVKVAIQPV